MTGSCACQAYLDGSSSHLERVAAGSADDDDGQYVYEEPDTPQEMCSVEVLRGLLEWVKADPCYDVKEEEKEVEKRVSAYLPARHTPRAARRAPIRDTRYARRYALRDTRGCARRAPRREAARAVAQICKATSRKKDETENGLVTMMVCRPQPSGAHRVAQPQGSSAGGPWAHSVVVAERLLATVSRDLFSRVGQQDGLPLRASCLLRAATMIVIVRCVTHYL